MLNTLRNWTRGILRMRKPRALPRRGPKPAIGSGIFREDLRITVLAGFGDELWQWLMDSGWRELRYRPDRRHYREIPTNWVTRLIDANPDERPVVLQGAAASAVRRPMLGDPTAIPSYVIRD